MESRHLLDDVYSHTTKKSVSPCFVSFRMTRVAVWNRDTICNTCDEAILDNFKDILDMFKEQPLYF